MTAAEFAKWMSVFKLRAFIATVAAVFTTPTRAIVTSATATGFQISATRDAEVRYEGTFTTTTTIGGPSQGEILLETALTNSTTASDWTVIARQPTGNTATLAVVLQLVSKGPWSLSRRIKAGAWVRIRLANVTGTVSAAINAELQEVLL